MRLFPGVLAGLLAAAAAAPETTLVGYLGGSGTDDCDGIALDRAGDLYLACHSDSPDFPGASASRDGMDAVVVKIDARAGKLVWAMRTGGSGWDGAGDVAVAPDGSGYVLGSTRSVDFPTTEDAVQRRFGGPERDVFLLKLDTKGNIVYSTLLGGSKNDEATGLAVDDAGTVYIAGVTMSADFPGSPARIGPGGPPDAFVARLRPGDPRSLRSAVIGGKGMDHASGIALDRKRNLFVAGYTASPDFPVKDAVQPRFGGAVDAFLVQLRSADWTLLSSTYLGGAKMDGAYAVALDSSGNPILSGVTESDDFPSTPSAFQPRRRGPVDAFVTKISAGTGRILWSTYFGGSKANSDQFQGGSLTVDDAGRVWLTGMTSSPDLPTKDAAQASYGGGDFDGFLASFSSDGSKLCWGSYAGGSGHDILEGVAARQGKVYASGLSSSKDLRQNRARIQPGYGGGPYDAVVFGWSAPPDRSCN